MDFSKKSKFKSFLKRPLVLLAVVAMVASSLVGSLAAFTNKASAASITTAPNATTIKSGMMADAKYNFIAQWNGSGKSTVSVFGTPNNYDASAMIAHYNGKVSSNATSLKSVKTGFVPKASLKGKAGFTFSNVGYVGTQNVDLRATMMNYTLASDMGSYKPNIGVKPNEIGFFESALLNTKWKYEIVKHGTTTSVTTSGFYTFNDLDAGQYITFDKATVAGLQNIYVPTATIPTGKYMGGKNTNWISYSKGTDGSEKFYTNVPVITSGANTTQANSSSDMDKYAMFTATYNSLSAVTFTYGELHNNKDGSAANKAVNHAVWYFGYAASKPLPSAPTPPKKLVSDSDQKNVTDNTLTSSVEPYTYTIRQLINKEISENYYSNADFTDNVDSRVKVTGVKVVLAGTSTDVTSKYFTNKTSGNNVKLSATAAALKDSTFYGKNYDVQISVKPNGGNTTKLDIPNTGSWNINKQPVTSNKVITHIPPKVDTGITKTVSTDNETWGNTATIDDLTKDYFYKSEVTVGDHNGSDVVSSVAVRENFENLQSYSNLKVSDSTGTDITANGTVTKSTSGKTTQITWTAKNPATLVGKKVIMTVNANLKSATTSQLEDYMTSGKIQIPNTTDAVINGTATPSNKTEVTPKLIKDFQAKYLEK
ncbi:isopeptide-forming domain-containing fimbrial protein [Pediococcus sp. M21F004]|uniref:isopeptide-forming domain-containing fimbrial protein n=1 Tax=Pediococcus sp. M21F004 TaxID=3390033 RepID=UPI003DA7423D